MMLFRVLFFGTFLVKLILSFIELKYKSNNQSKKLWISMICLYSIIYSFLIIMVYLITDTLVDFIVVTFCFLVINFMHMTVYKRWFHSNLVLRLLLVGITPIFTLLILFSINKFQLTENIIQFYVLLIIISTTELKPKGKYERLEIVFYLLSIVIIGIVLRTEYLSITYNKPQIYVFDKMSHELGIGNNDIIAIGDAGGLRGELIAVSFHTASHYYKVYYKNGNIIEIKLIR